MPVYRSVCRYILFAIAISSSFAFAKFEFPPQLKTEQAIARRARALRAQLPEIVTSASHALSSGNNEHHFPSLEGTLKREQEFIDEIKHLPKYLEAVSARPPLRTWLFERLSTRRADFNGARNEAWRRFVHESQELALRRQAHEWADELDEQLKMWQSQTAKAFFDGLSQFLPDDKRPLLGIPDLKTRWQALRPIFAKIRIEDLRAKFRISRFGLYPANWSLDDLDRLFDEIDAREELLAKTMAAHYMRNTANDLPWIFKESRKAYLVERAHGDKRVLSALEALTRRLQALYTETDQQETNEIYAIRRLVLREVPPHLAVYRGCMGADCATTASPFIPYAPNERNWWIEDEIGRRLGYASGAITEQGGKPCLYIRDITGRGIQNDDIELILTGFYLVHREFGAAAMTMSNEAFTNQNHFTALQAALSTYRSQFAPDYIDQTFPDGWFRSEYLTSQGDYDNIDKHSSVRGLNVPADVLKGFRASDITGHSRPNDFRKNPDLLWDQLALAVQFDSAEYLKNAFPRERTDWKSLLTVLRNDKGLRVAEFLKALEDEFTKLQLPFSQNLLRKYERITQGGYFRAPDRFAKANERQTVRHVIDIVWRSATPEAAASWILPNLKTFENSEMFQRQVLTLFERRGFEDEERLKALWRAGFRFKNVLGITQEGFLWMLENAEQSEIDEMAAVAFRSGQFDSLQWAEYPRYLTKIFYDVTTVEQIRLFASFLPKLARLKDASHLSIWKLVFQTAAIFKDLDVETQFRIALHTLENGTSSDDELKRLYEFIVDNLDNEFIKKPQRDLAYRLFRRRSEDLKVPHAALMQKYQGHERPRWYSSRTCRALLGS